MNDFIYTLFLRHECISRHIKTGCSVELASHLAEPAHELLHHCLALTCVDSKLLAQGAHPFLAFCIPSLDLAAKHVQFSISGIFSLLRLKRSLLLFQFLYFSPQPLGSHDRLLAVFHKSRDLLKLSNELLIEEDELLLNLQRRKVRIA